MSNTEARKWYLSAEAQMLKQIDKNASLEVQAYQISNLRNYYRNEARAAMKDQDLASKLKETDPLLTWDEVVNLYTQRGYKGD